MLMYVQYLNYVYSTHLNPKRSKTCTTGLFVMSVVHNVTVSKHTYDIIKYIDMIEICDFLVVCRVVKKRISHTKVSFLILKDTSNLRRKKTIIGTEMLVYFSGVHLISVSMNVPIFRSYLLI